MPDATQARGLASLLPEMRTVVFQACAPLPPHSPSCVRSRPSWSSRLPRGARPERIRPSSVSHGVGGQGSRRLSLAETAQLFSRAALIVGPHGGAFLNMIYLPPGAPHHPYHPHAEKYCEGNRALPLRCKLESCAPTSWRLHRHARGRDRVHALKTDGLPELLPHDGATARPPVLDRARPWWLRFADRRARRRGRRVRQCGARDRETSTGPSWCS